jgi:N-acetylglutamate synthase-like GNAT family acetyltransferase
MFPDSPSNELEDIGRVFALVDSKGVEGGTAHKGAQQEHQIEQWHLVEREHYVVGVRGRNAVQGRNNEKIAQKSSQNK